MEGAFIFARIMALALIFSGLLVTPFIDVSKAGFQIALGLTILRFTEKDKRP